MTGRQTTTIPLGQAKRWSEIVGKPKACYQTVSVSHGAGMPSQHLPKFRTYPADTNCDSSLKTNQLGERIVSFSELCQG